METGEVVVYPGRGLARVVAVETREGAEFVVVQEEGGTKVFVPRDKAPGLLRPVIGPTEAERRLAVLRSTTPEGDPRSFAARYTARTRTLAKGTDEERATELRRLYVSSFAPSYADRRLIDRYERALVPEIAQVLGRAPDDLVRELHELHATSGTFAKAARPRPAEPPAPRPVAPVAITGHEFLGSFTIARGSIVAGDPAYLGSTIATRRHGDASPNVVIQAAAGEWYGYVRPDAGGSGVAALVAVHASAAGRAANLEQAARKVAMLWVDGGRMAILDAEVRDKEAFADAMLFRADPEGVIEGRGCISSSGAGDGVYPALAATEGGKAVLLLVAF